MDKIKLDKRTVTLIVSVLLNLLGGLGLVDPLPGVQCTEACPCAPGAE